jgi:hypothetical protein
MIVVGLVAGAVITAPVAQAESCPAHLAKHDYWEEGDIQYHKLYGGKSPCQKDYKPGDEAHTDEPMSKSDTTDSTSGSDGYKRDKFGQGCTLFGCG